MRSISHAAGHKSAAQEVDVPSSELLEATKATSAVRRRLRHARSLAIAVIVVIVAIAIVSQAVAIYDVMAGHDLPVITDLDRDLVGAEAIGRGVQPYTTLGRLRPDLPAEWAETWVAHSPVSIVLARGLNGVFDGRAQVVFAYRWMSLVALAALSWLLIRVKSRDSLLPLAAITVAIWAPTISDFRWVQGQTLVALGLFAVLTLHAKSRRTWAFALLGVLVAWKPWLAFFALFLPGSSAPLKDLFKVGVISAGLTIAVLPWTGGWNSLQAWLFEAMPLNTELSRVIHTGVLSFTAQVPLAYATAIYIAMVIIALALGRRTLSPQVWPALGALTHLAYGPLVWDHYWLALLPVICWPIISGATESFVRWSVGGWLVLSALSHPVYWPFDWPVSIELVAYGFLASVPVGLAGIWWGALRNTWIRVFPRARERLNPTVTSTRIEALPSR